MSKTIKLDFDGCYQTKNLPLEDHQCSGIYTVYAGKLTEQNNCSLRKLLYIGESVNVGSRPGKTHESYKEWCRYLIKEKKERLFYAFADISDTDRERAEAALIFHHQPPCNDQNTESFDYPETRIIITGIIDKLDTDFTEPN